MAPDEWVTNDMSDQLLRNGNKGRLSGHEKGGPPASAT